MKHGDYTGLAADYSANRPDYSRSVLDALLALVGKERTEIDAVDVGAGTGIWSRMLTNGGLRSVIAVEPNDDMRAHGKADSEGLGVEWRKGGGEETGLPDACCDMVSMASSFHWVDFDKGCQEFYRILRPGGRFVALWNPRFLEATPLLQEIEDHLSTLKSDIKRVSSGRSGLTETLTEKLRDSSCFDDVVYLEGTHVIRMSPKRYLGAWKSVNDLRVQLGPKKFDDFLAYVEERISGLKEIEAVYLTRAWSARKA